MSKVRINILYKVIPNGWINLNSCINCKTEGHVASWIGYSKSSCKTFIESTSSEKQNAPLKTSSSSSTLKDKDPIQS
ncbi:hypothetical protein CEXT_404121 [Caerostris extrusa]|uniref:Uncharacterized protein n=1 Tax=Caerostris extrusa TaxID=172846 RepID=A0AAV4NK96_CAEEX|nr:hypothetical protein CEXT_404121 [Caerostris extrusa]